MSRINELNYIEKIVVGRRGSVKKSTYSDEWISHGKNTALVIFFPIEKRHKKFKIKIEFVGERKPIEWYDFFKSNGTRVQIPLKKVPWFKRNRAIGVKIMEEGVLLVKDSQKKAIGDLRK